MISKFEQTPANYVPLTPVSLLKRTAMVHPDRAAVVYGEISFSYVEFLARCTALASALRERGIKSGDVVSILAPNTPCHLEAHFGVPMAGAVLHSMNTRLDAATISFMLAHSESRLVIVDIEYVDLVRKALATMKAPPPLVVVEDHHFSRHVGSEPIYQKLLEGACEVELPELENEWDAIALNYTSGTTGDPKGVVYHHRGAYLNAVANVLAWGMVGHPTFLWTLPLFHCNGWCMPWTITALAGTHICLRRVDTDVMIDALVKHEVTHLAGAPIILSRLVNAPEPFHSRLPRGVRMMVAGAPPAAAVIGAAESLGWEVTQTYGLTEVFGPCVVCEWKDEWNELPLARRAELKSRQGVRYELQEAVEVLDPDTMEEITADGETLGEIMIRGNLVMKGYLKNDKATSESFAGGWFHTGDLAVKHPDGYIEIRDRSKDIIISGGENISSIEVEGILLNHSAVLEAAVVARRDEKWGERPCAFVVLRPDVAATPAEIEEFCRSNLAKFKVPTVVICTEIPKTSTGKVRKTELRQLANAAT
jgi:fatty-acyl-CoA synthase